MAVLQVCVHHSISRRVTPRLTLRRTRGSIIILGPTISSEDQRKGRRAWRNYMNTIPPRSTSATRLLNINHNGGRVWLGLQTQNQGSRIATVPTTDTRSRARQDGVALLVPVQGASEQATRRISRPLTSQFYLIY